MFHILNEKCWKKKKKSCETMKKLNWNQFHFQHAIFFTFYSFFVISKNEERISRLNEFLRFLSFFLAYGTDDDDDDDKGRNEYTERFVYEKILKYIIANQNECLAMFYAVSFALRYCEYIKFMFSFCSSSSSSSCLFHRNKNISFFLLF